MSSIFYAFSFPVNDHSTVVSQQWCNSTEIVQAEFTSKCYIFAFVSWLSFIFSSVKGSELFKVFYNKKHI